MEVNEKIINELENWIIFLKEHNEDISDFVLEQNFNRGNILCDSDSDIINEIRTLKFSYTQTINH